MNAFLDAQDLQYEDEAANNPYSLRTWLNYLEYKKNSPVIQRFAIYERGLSFLPRSYKLWHRYLQERRSQLKNCSFAEDERFMVLVKTFERSLVHMNKMPRIWIEYCELLIDMKKGSDARRAFDRALQALPVTQHKEIWELYIFWAKDFGVSESVIKIYRRFLMFDSSFREEFVEYLISCGQYEEATRQLAICVDDEHFVSSLGRTKHQLWINLCNLCASHPEDTSRALNVDSVIRAGIAKFSDEVGRLWCRLADFYIKQGHFEKARDVFEEGLNSVVTVRDFSLIFETYLQVEESLLSEKMGSSTSSQEEKEVEYLFSRLEYLVDQRPLLLNSVLLRQNPQLVETWLQRSKLLQNDPSRQVMCLIEALQVIDTNSFPTNGGKKVKAVYSNTSTSDAPSSASSSLAGVSRLWLALSSFYEQKGDYEQASAVLSRGVHTGKFHSVDDLARIWCAWAELELQQGHHHKALSIVREAVTEPSMGMKDQGVQSRIHRNGKIWRLYVDLEECFGTLDSCRAAYERAFDWKLITPIMVLNYAAILEEHHFFEDSFQVYEKSLALFGFPEVKKIWKSYLKQFWTRYGTSKVERWRDLWEQALLQCPSTEVAEFALEYAKGEESMANYRQALAIYHRALGQLPDEQKADWYRLMIKKVEKFYGWMKSRPLYEKAIQELPEDQARSFCLDYAAMERKLGEIDRARAIFLHGSQFSDPRKASSYWKIWREFEEMHGNEDTFRDMLRVQRTIEAAYSQVNYLAAEMLAGESIQANTMDELEAMALRDRQDLLESSENLGLRSKFVPSSTLKTEPSESLVSSSSSSSSSTEKILEEGDIGSSEEDREDDHDDDANEVSEEEEEEEDSDKDIDSSTAGKKRSRWEDDDGEDDDSLTTSSSSKKAKKNDEVFNQSAGQSAQEEEDVVDMGIAMKPVPQAVFGSLSKSAGKETRK